MKNLQTTFIFLFILCSSSLSAQNISSWDSFIQNYSEDDNNSDGWKEVYETLCELHEHPMNINTATREDLGRLPFITEEQIEEIQAYIYSHGEMKTLGELLLIESLDYETRKMLEFFVFAGDKERAEFPGLNKLIKYGKSDLLASSDVPLYDCKGDNNGYLGYKYANSFRYNYHYSDFIKLGIVGSQDAGEPFFAGKNRFGYDFYSYYFVLKNYGRLKCLAVGCYRVSFGMGLVVNSDFSLGKTAALVSMGRSNNNIRAHPSQSESNYFDGVAATVEVVKNLSLSAFLSYRMLDATLNKDEASVSSIIDGGYHRTETEMGKKGNLRSKLVGGNVHYFIKGFHLGATAVYTDLSRCLSPDMSSIYRRYYARGKDFFNIGSDYGYICHRYKLNGEVAFGKSGGVATVNNLNVRLRSDMELIAVQRFYSYRYSSLYSQSFSEGGSVQNESGIYIGVKWQPSRKLNVMAYTDYFCFAWPKYQISKSSSGMDNMFSIAYLPEHWSFNMRYRIKLRQKDDENKTSLKNNIRQTARISSAYAPNKNAEWRMQADVSAAAFNGKSDCGYMINGSFLYKYKDFLRFNVSFGYFNTDSYDSRIYTYEPGLLYSFSFPSYYGEGFRSSAIVHADISQSLALTVKAGITKYLDRKTIGSALQQISSSSKSNIDCQLRWKF